MENVVIRELEFSDLEAFLDYAEDWKKDTFPFTIDEVKVYETMTAENFGEWQELIRREEKVARGEDFSSATKYFAFIEGKIAGVVSCRWQIEKGILLEWGGHIGYGVAPSFRGHHLAEQMVQFVLEKYRERGIFRVMISADEENWASRKTIERSGGLLENTVEIGDERICRYWIDLTKR